MYEYVQEQAKQRIGYAANNRNVPWIFSEQDWKQWRKVLEEARRVTQNEELKVMARETIEFFNEYFYR